MPRYPFMVLLDPKLVLLDPNHSLVTESKYFEPHLLCTSLNSELMPKPSFKGALKPHVPEENLSTKASMPGPGELIKSLLFMS